MLFRSGVTLVRTDTGVASLYIEVPQGVAARIRSSMGLGRVDVDQARFPRVADGWQSPDVATAANRVDLEAEMARVRAQADAHVTTATAQTLAATAELDRRSEEFRAEIERAKTAAFEQVRRDRKSVV